MLPSNQLQQRSQTVVSFLLNAAMVSKIFVGGTILTVSVLNYITDRT